ncbi:RNA polymerase sigma factor [Natronospira bacteriovora]|uniref:RNA polymerase sigma factor n=1 Tax=Natronospira bacteriovora TaxID=3069753 RepID=A0ABU0W7F3_9GAMM|nr:RNA polymerase sigma factor [Natronospira sp. AB-CW4]MDQ2069931.1 RNA polymerase sigma factor [Natronospira sp. AB-CW4]
MQDSLDEFLASVELRAFHLVRLRLGSADDAHDVVQDGMERFVRHYRDKPREEWTRLFYGIIHNRVRDYQRHGQVRNRVLQTPRPDEEDGSDPVERAEGPAALRPEERVGTDDSMQALAAAIGELPERQQEAVTLRIIQGMDVAETAAAMGCSEGSVKTHLSRALGALREVLGEHR